MKDNFAHLSQNKILLLVFASIQTTYVILSIHFPFFWDATYHSQVALHIYEQNFLTIFPEPNTDAGHPTLFNLYLAFGWRILGKSIEVSHLLQLPFAWLYVYFTYQLIKKYVPLTWQWVAILLLCLEATLTAQIMSLNVDIPLLSGFFMALYGIDRQKNKWIIIGTTFLSLLSIRGWIMSFALFAIDLHYNQWNIKKYYLYLKRYFLFGFCIVIWLIAHKIYTKNWFASPIYQSNFCFVVIPKNIVVFFFRLLDVGRLVLWLVVLWLIFKERNRILRIFNFEHFLLYSAVITLITFFICFVPVTNPIGHRYFMVVYVLVIIWAVQMSSKYFKKWHLAPIGICFVIGHIWIYPAPIANGWDASLAHISYFSLKKKIWDYMQLQGIPFNQVYTYPPLHKSAYITDLDTHKTENLPLLNKENFEKAHFILYSNISNHFNRPELEKIKTQYIRLYEVKKGLVECAIYQKNKNFYQK
ncbi:MAG: hypothetical protein NZ519_02370 [Bacteroidia bacterium]|nr:hypothetical protein [Bacteroidia bacterium]